MPLSQLDIEIIRELVNEIVHGPPRPLPESEFLNGASRVAQKGGRLTIEKIEKEWDSLSEKQKQNCPRYWYFPQGNLNAKYSNPDDRYEADYHLGNRNFIIWGQRMLECKPIELKLTPKPGVDVSLFEPNYREVIVKDGFIPNTYAFGWGDKEKTAEDCYQVFLEIKNRSA